MISFLYHFVMNDIIYIIYIICIISIINDSDFFIISISFLSLMISFLYHVIINDIIYIISIINDSDFLSFYH